MNPPATAGSSAPARRRPRAGKCAAANPGHIAYHTAAERHDLAVPGKTIRHQHIQDSRDIREGLVRLAVRQNDFHDAARLESWPQTCIQIKRSNSRVADDEHIARRHVLAQQIRLAEQAIADQDRVATTA